MYIDNEAELTTAVKFDLGSVRPGPGKPIKMYATGVGGSLVITTGVADGNEGAGITVDATNDLEFHLPSDTEQFIIATFATGRVFVVMDGQTNDAAFA